MIDPEPQPIPAPPPVAQTPAPHRTGFQRIMAEAVRRLRDKGRHYWVTTVLILAIATLGSQFVYNQLKLGDARSYLFQHLLEGGLNPPESKDIKIVLIGDDDYWQGELAGRRPVKRDYLARLVDKLVALNVYVIALDFDVRLPNPGSMEIPDDYKAETQILIDAIEAAARQGKKLVLATPLSFAGKRNQYRRDSDIYQANGLCLPHDAAAAAKQPAWFDNIVCGYIILPYDPLAVPPVVDLSDGSTLDPFSLAIAKAVRPGYIARVTKQIGRQERYASFISHDGFTESNSVFSAQAVRSGLVERSELDSKVVIVGAYWSRDAAGRGPKVDEHPTPAGRMVGAEMHANFAEALLNRRVFSGISKTILEISEVAFSVLAALIFAVVRGFLGKVVAIVTVLVVMFIATAVALRGFGVFFDVFVPLVGLGLHSLYESLFGESKADQAGPATA
jgi:CHASE2 domain-containing sensor protein